MWERRGKRVGRAAWPLCKMDGPGWDRSRDPCELTGRRGATTARASAPPPHPRRAELVEHPPVGT